MNKITMMIGLPRCGKSTYVKNSMGLRPRVVVSCDDIRMMLYGSRFLAEREEEVWNTFYIMLETVAKSGIDIIIDNTNTTRAVRRNIFDLADKYEYSVEGLYFNPNVDLCTKRALETGQEDLVDIIRYMNERFEFPIKDEPFKSITEIKR